MPTGCDHRSRSYGDKENVITFEPALFPAEQAGERRRPCSALASDEAGEFKCIVAHGRWREHRLPLLDGVPQRDALDRQAVNVAVGPTRRLRSPLIGAQAHLELVGQLLLGQAGYASPARLEHDPEKACPGLDPGWVPVFGKGLPPRRRGSCSTNKLERDDERKKSHHALAPTHKAVFPGENCPIG